MDEETITRPIRLVIAAPFPEIVSLHERAAEYADELDVCGAITDASGVVDQTRLLHPDVLMLSSRLGDAGDFTARLAATSASTEIVVVGRDNGANGSVAADASGADLCAAVVAASQRGASTSSTSPEAGAATDDSHDGPTWFSDNRFGSPRPVAPTADAPAERHARRALPTWPPPWFRVVAPEPVEVVASPPAPDSPAVAAPAEPEEPPPAEPPTAEKVAAGEPAVVPGPAAVVEPVSVPAATADAVPGPAATEEPVPNPAAAALTEPVPKPAAAAPAEPKPEPTPEPIQPQPTRPAKKPGRARAETVLIFSGKGGVGKSVIASNLAVALSRRGAAVAVVDLNLQYGDVGVLFHLDGHTTTIESLAQHGDQVDAEFLDEVMAVGPENVRALLAPSSPEFADLVTAAGLRAIFRELGRNYDYIIVDSASHLEELVLEVMEIADQIIVVTAFHITAVKDTKVTLKLLQSLGIERNRVAVALNQTKAKVRFLRDDIEKSLNFAVLAELPYEPRIDDTIDTGTPMAMTNPKSDFSKQLNVIVEHLMADPAETEKATTAKKRFGLRR